MSVTDMYANGIMKQLLDKGIITPTVYRSLEIFMEVKNLELSGKKRTHAVEEIAQKCRVCEDTVWRAIKKIEA